MADQDGASLNRSRRKQYNDPSQTSTTWSSSSSIVDSYRKYALLPAVIVEASGPVTLHSIPVHNQRANQQSGVPAF